MSMAPKLPPPIGNSDISGYYYNWEKGEPSNIAIGVTRIREDSARNAIEAEIEIAYKRSKSNGTPVNLLSHVRTNLLSLSGRDTLVRSIKANCLEDDLQYYPWNVMVNQVCNLTINNVRKGEPLKWLSEEGANRPEYILPPLFPKNSASIVYADKSSAKSLFMTLIDITLTLPWHDNNLGLNISPDDKRVVLFLDWENDAEITGWQKSCIIRGMELGWCDVPYLHCSRPLADSVDHIRNKIKEIGADTIIIDSLGMAVGDDLNLTKPAFAFYGALRQLPVTPLIIAHTSKGIDNRRKTVYGNAYYENEARSVWEIIKEQQPGSNELTITLQHRKSPPFAGYSEPLAWRFIFDEDKTMVETATPQQDQRISSDAPPSETDIALEIIMDSKGKPMSAGDIVKASAQKIKPTNIYTVMARIIKRPEFKVTKTLDGHYLYTN